MVSLHQSAKTLVFVTWPLNKLAPDNQVKSRILTVGGFVTNLKNFCCRMDATGGQKGADGQHGTYYHSRDVRTYTEGGRTRIPSPRICQAMHTKLIYIVFPDPPRGCTTSNAYCPPPRKKFSIQPCTVPIALQTLA